MNVLTEDICNQVGSGLCPLLSGTNYYLFDIVNDGQKLRLFDADQCEFLDRDVTDIVLSFSFSISLPKSVIENRYYEEHKESVGFASSLPKENVSLEEKEKTRLKILKLMNLARSNNNIEEAKNAILQAQRLMYQYGVKNDDGFDDFDLVNKEKKVTTRYSDYVHFAIWKYDLMVVIAENFRCKSYFVGKSSGKANFVFFGLEDEAGMAKELFDFAVNVAEASCDIYIKDRKKAESELELQAILAFEVERLEAPFLEYETHFHNYYVKPDYKQLKLNYFSGFVDGLRDSFVKQSEEMSLVLVTDALVVQEYEKFDIKTVNFSKKTQVVYIDGHSREQGYERGNSLTKDSELMQGDPLNLEENSYKRVITPNGITITLVYGGVVYVKVFERGFCKDFNSLWEGDKIPNKLLEALKSGDEGLIFEMLTE